jgi:hypothetical protein
MVKTQKNDTAYAETGADKLEIDSKPSAHSKRIQKAPKIATIDNSTTNVPSENQNE